jgi:hypothetical protein
MTGTKDFGKIDADLRDVLEDVADDTLERSFGSLKTASHEAAIFWLLARGDDDALQAALDAHGYDSVSALIEAVQERQFGGQFDAGFSPQDIIQTPDDLDGGRDD